MTRSAASSCKEIQFKLTPVEFNSIELKLIEFEAGQKTNSFSAHHFEECNVFVGSLRLFMRELESLGSCSIGCSVIERTDTR